MQEWIVEPGDDGMRLDQWLVARGGAPSRARASEWIDRGKVYLGGEAIDRMAASHRLRAGECVGVWMDRPGSSKTADRSTAGVRHLLRVVHEDADLVVIDKPVGMIVEPLPGRAQSETTVLDLLRDAYRHQPRARAYVVHRIDRDTSGLVLLARSVAARDALKEQFEQRTPERVYLAIVMGEPSPARGTWRDKLAWDADALRQRKAHGTDARGKDAEAVYKVVESFGVASLIEVRLVTGKRNQIRVQAAMRGHPLLGERQYRHGAPPEPAGLPQVKRQALHAWKLGFIHPGTGRRVTFESPVPQDLDSALGALRAAACR